jgi:hypothetical protein
LTTEKFTAELTVTTKMKQGSKQQKKENPMLARESRRFFKLEYIF